MFPLTRRKTGPLTVFVHVPKTAGSTVNQHLSDWSKAGLTHAERFLGKPGKLARRLPRLHWISGHIALNKFLKLLGDTTDRKLHFFGLMRDPAAQVASQYNWQIEIFRRGGRFYRSHPASIRAISERIRATDNTDPAAIIANLQADPGLFLNLQSRFLLGDEIDLDSPAFDDRLARYDLIAATPETVIERITGTRPTATRQNTSPYHFDPAVFDTPALRDFLARENRHDLRLYTRITAKQ